MTNVLYWFSDYFRTEQSIFNLGMGNVLSQTQFLPLWYGIIHIHIKAYRYTPTHHSLSIYLFLYSLTVIFNLIHVCFYLLNVLQLLQTQVLAFTSLYQQQSIRFFNHTTTVNLINSILCSYFCIVPSSQCSGLCSDLFY